MSERDKFLKSYPILQGIDRKDYSALDNSTYAVNTSSGVVTASKEDLQRHVEQVQLRELMVAERVENELNRALGSEKKRLLDI